MCLNDSRLSIGQFSDPLQSTLMHNCSCEESTGLSVRQRGKSASDAFHPMWGSYYYRMREILWKGPGLLRASF
jgi:hypothetical protein